MTAFPKISIVTTNYNYGQFLEETLCSVLDQNYPNLEYIVIDGGSTDDSVDIIKRYAHRLTYWLSEADAGQAHAINKGLRRSTGEIVGFLNSDDLYLPDTLARVAEAFASPDTVWIGAPCEILDGEGRKTGIGKAMTHASAFQWVCGGWFPQPSTFWRRRLMLEEGYFEEHLHYDFDQEYWARLAVAGYRPQILDQVLSRDRQHADRKTADPGMRAVQERLFIAHKYLHRLPPAEGTALRCVIRGHERVLLRDPFYQDPPPPLSKLLTVIWQNPDLLRDRRTWGLIRQRLFSQIKES